MSCTLGAETSNIVTHWTLLHKTKKSALIRRFSDDLTKWNILIVTALTAMTAMDLPDNSMVIHQANEFLYLPANMYSVFSTIQMRENQAQVYDIESAVVIYKT